MKELFLSVYLRIFPWWTNYLRKELSGCETLLDLGCGNKSPLQCAPVPYSVGVELFKPYLEESKKRRIHSQYILADIREIEFKENSFDTVLLLGLIEHLSAEDVPDLIKKAKKWAKKKVIVSTSSGFVRQEDYEGNPLQVHKTGWTPAAMKELGFEIHGARGWKALYGYNTRLKRTQLRFRPAMFWQVISDITQKITYFCPKYALDLFCVWGKT